MYQYIQVVECVQKLCVDCAYNLPSDVLGALIEAHAAESNARAKEILEKLIKNAQIAKDERIPLCQDTGLTVVFVEQGANTVVSPLPEKPTATIIDAIQDGVAQRFDVLRERSELVERRVSHPVPETHASTSND